MTPLQRATGERNVRALILETAQLMGCSFEEAEQTVMAERQQEEIWLNEIYQVATIRSTHEIFGEVMQINIRRRDGNVIFRDWRHFQDIKNQLAGPECEGLELYPAESRLVDTANKYHLWVILNPELGIPIGWHEGRNVTNGRKGKQLPGHRQRPLPKHWKESKHDGTD
jgi:hypothetical protein